MENIRRMEKFNTEELQNLLFFMLEGSDKIKDNGWTTQICVREVIKNIKLSFTNWTGSSNTITQQNLLEIILSFMLCCKPVQLDANKRPTPPKYSQCISQLLILNRKRSVYIIHAEQPKIQDKALSYISPFIQEFVESVRNKLVYPIGIPSPAKERLK